MTQFLVQGKEQQRVERIKNTLRCAADSFLMAGLDLREAYRAADWLVLGLPNFTAYCGQFDFSDSWAYDLIAIADVAESFPDYRSRILDAGIGKMRLLLPHIPEKASADQIDTLLDEANTKSWNELRKELNPGRPSEPIFADCPFCHNTLSLSRAAQVKKP